MLANPAGYLTGHCGATNPESHAACRGAVTRGSESNDLGELICVCLCHTDQREAYLQQLTEAVSWRTRDLDTGEIKFFRTEAEAHAYAAENEAYKEDAARNAALLPDLDPEELALLAANG